LIERAFHAGDLLDPGGVELLIRGMNWNGARAQREGDAAHCGEKFACAHVDLLAAMDMLNRNSFESG
jgi:hypothetical protein